VFDQVVLYDLVVVLLDLLQFEDDLPKLAPVGIGFDYGRDGSPAFVAWFETDNFSLETEVDAFGIEALDYTY
jgi:hypothetical protein